MIFNQIGGGTAKYKVLVGTVDTPTTYPSAYSVSISDTSIKATDTAISARLSLVSASNDSVFAAGIYEYIFPVKYSAMFDDYGTSVQWADVYYGSKNILEYVRDLYGDGYCPVISDGSVTLRLPRPLITHATYNYYIILKP